MACTSWQHFAARPCYRLVVTCLVLHVLLHVRLSSPAHPAAPTQRDAAQWMKQLGVSLTCKRAAADGWRHEVRDWLRGAGLDAAKFLPALVDLGVRGVDDLSLVEGRDWGSQIYCQFSESARTARKPTNKLCKQ